MLFDSPVPWGWTHKHASPGCKLLDRPFDREGNRFVELMACKPPSLTGPRGDLAELIGSREDIGGGCLFKI